jgi:uncharacterized membrane protein
MKSLLIAAALFATQAQAHTFRLCNRAADTVSFAMVVDEQVDGQDQWSSRGWYNVAPNTCSFQFDSWNEHVYVYAANYHNGMIWTDVAHRFNGCVDEANAFDIKNPDADESCKADSMRFVPFKEYILGDQETALEFRAADAIPGEMRVDLDLCNDTDQKVSAAIGYGKTGGGLGSWGWLSIDPHACSAGWLYATLGTIYVSADAGDQVGTYGGNDAHLCVDDVNAFDYYDAETRACTDAGTSKRGFFKAAFEGSTFSHRFQGL